MLTKSGSFDPLWLMNLCLKNSHYNQIDIILIISVISSFLNDFLKKTNAIYNNQFFVPLTGVGPVSNP